MTEAEWLACENPWAMMEYVLSHPRMARSKKGRRKVRLANVACTRLLVDLFPEPTFRNAINVAERLADGEASREETGRASAQAKIFCAKQFGQAGSEPPNQEGVALYQVARACASLADTKARDFALSGVIMAYGSDRRDDMGICQRQAELLRCVFGNLFHEGAVPAGWENWNDGTLPRLALSVYNERDFTRLSILADALEDAGFTAEAILSHLRSPGPHVRGCWALDLILGRT
jgi:hypothetical protein